MSTRCISPAHVKGTVTLISLVLFLLCLSPVAASGPFETTSTTHTHPTELTGLSNIKPQLRSIRGGSMSATEVEEEVETNSNVPSDDRILIVFSDLDGTLLHYPDEVPESESPNRLLKLPPSSTGMRGVISSKTLLSVQMIRKRGIKFGLVSGMRTTTMLTRMPYLPRADAYCSEAGGRIFYPTEDLSSASFIVKPEAYDGATPEDLEPFGLVEDIEWRERMERFAGKIGRTSLQKLYENPKALPGVESRTGVLWEFARSLIEKGYVLDVKGYEACFRVNRKQQNEQMTDDDFKALVDGRIEIWEGLSTSINLSCVDYYPKESGKKNCCQYLADKWCPQQSGAVLATNSVCLCDDDNDLEMALACNHAYIPELSSESMAKTISENPQHFTQTGGEGAAHKGTEASEVALGLVLSRIDGR